MFLQLSVYSGFAELLRPQFHHRLSRAAEINQWSNCACICYTETNFNVKPFNLIQLFNPVTYQLFNQVKN